MQGRNKKKRKEKNLGQLKIRTWQLGRWNWLGRRLGTFHTSSSIQPSALPFLSFSSPFTHSSSFYSSSFYSTSSSPFYAVREPSAFISTSFYSSYKSTAPLYCSVCIYWSKIASKLPSFGYAHVLWIFLYFQQ